MALPKDPNMLYSVVNMRLRDQYQNLDELCASESVDRRELERILGDAGFSYDAETNRFN